MRMERNFTNVKGFSFLPKRVCLNKAGPFIAMRVMMATTSIGSAAIKSRMNESRMSKKRFTPKQVDVGQIIITNKRFVFS